MCIDKVVSMNFVYSYFAGILSGFLVAFAVGQNPINNGINLIIFLLITFFVGLIAVNFIYFCVSFKNKTRLKKR